MGPTSYSSCVFSHHPRLTITFSVFLSFYSCYQFSRKFDIILYLYQSNFSFARLCSGANNAICHTTHGLADNQHYASLKFVRWNIEFVDNNDALIMDILYDTSNY